MNFHEVNLDGVLRPLNEENSKLVLQKIPKYRPLSFINKLILCNNNLNSVPDLSYLTTLTFIDTSSNNMSSIPNLPLGIETITVCHNLIVEVDVTKYVKLTKLDISLNPTRNLCKLPPNLIEFRATNTEFTKFKDDLPNNIEFIEFDYSRITEIPTIPLSLVCLYINNTNIQSITIKNGDSKLERLYCNNTPINSLNNLENTKLVKLKCHMCPNLTSIPNLPATIIKLNCGGTPSVYTNLKLPKICDTKLKTLCMTYTTNTFLPILPKSLTRLIVPLNKLNQLGVLKHTSISQVCINYNNLSYIPEVPSTLNSWFTDYILRVDGMEFPLNILDYEDENHTLGNSLTAPFDGTVEDIKKHYIELKDQIKNLNNTKLLRKRGLNDDVLSIIGSHFEPPKRRKTIHDQIQEKIQEITHSNVYYDISNKELTEMPDIPENVTHLNMSNNNIQYISNKLPPKLIELNCSNNKITLIDDLSNLSSLQTLKIGNNNLKCLPNLPNSIKNLIINNNNINKINKFPTLLIQFDCSFNKFKSFPNFPTTFSIFRCNNNLIRFFPNLKNTSLYEFDCSNNLIELIPEIPSTLSIYNAKNNKLIFKEQYELSTLKEYWKTFDFLNFIDETVILY